MKRFAGVLMAAVFAGCASNAPVVQIGGFRFSFEGKEYTIQSVTPSGVEGYNLLFRSEQGEVVLKAVDLEQDGILDEVLTGNVPLSEMNRIYKSGLQIGDSAGKLRVRGVSREYRTEIDFKSYILTTYVLGWGGIFNRMLVVELNGQQAVVVDRNADGELDMIEVGERDLAYYQFLYRILLVKGMRDGEVVKQEGMFVVEK